MMTDQCISKPVCKKRIRGKKTIPHKNHPVWGKKVDTGKKSRQYHSCGSISVNFHFCGVLLKSQIDLSKTFKKNIGFPRNFPKFPKNFWVKVVFGGSKKSSKKSGFFKRSRPKNLENHLGYQFFLS